MSNDQKTWTEYDRWRKRLCQMLSKGPMFLFEIRERCHCHPDQLEEFVSKIEMESLWTRMDKKECRNVNFMEYEILPEEFKIFFLDGEGLRARRRLDSVKRKNSEGIARILIRSAKFEGETTEKREKHDNEPGGVWVNPLNNPEWLAYEGQCDCESKWLEGYIWGSAAHRSPTSITFNVSSRPFPIIERLKRTLVAEGFSVSERQSDESNPDSFFIESSNPRIRNWNLPPIGKRRLGDKVKEDFLSGVLDARLRLHAYGYGVPGRSWVPDLKRILEKLGYHVHIYDFVLTISNSEAQKGIVGKFVNSLNVESEYYLQLTGKNLEALREEQTEESYRKISARLGEYEDPWPDDWFAGSILSLKEETTDIVQFNTERIPSRRMLGRILEILIARNSWFDHNGQILSMRLDSSLHDWISTNSAPTAPMRMGAFSGAIGIFTVECSTDSLIAAGPSMEGISGWLRNRVNEVYFDCQNEVKGFLELKSTVVLNPTLERIRTLLKDGPLPEYQDFLEKLPQSHIALRPNELSYVISNKSSIWGETLADFIFGK